MGRVRSGGEVRQAESGFEVVEVYEELELGLSDVLVVDEGETDLGVAGIHAH